jgi:hypothetical protein
MQSASTQEKSNSYEPSAINFHLQETSPREPQGSNLIAVLSEYLCIFKFSQHPLTTVFDIPRIEWRRRSATGFVIECFEGALALYVEAPKQKRGCRQDPFSRREHRLR